MEKEAYSFRKHFWQIQLKMEITWSKAMALIVLIFGLYIEMTQSTGGVIFMATLPFATFLITGRWIKEIKKENIKLKGNL